MPYFNSKKIADIIYAKEVKPLESEFEIEELFVAIKSMEEKIEYFEALKKKRAKDIEEEIAKIESKIGILKYVISLTMDATEKKSLNFPGTGKVSITERKGKWVIDKEDELLEMLCKELDENDYKRLIQTKTTYAKKEIDSYLDQWEQGGKIPPCVHRGPSSKPLKLSYTGEEIASYDEDEMEINISKNTSKDEPVTDKISKVDEENFDGLEI